MKRTVIVLINHKVGGRGGLEPIKYHSGSVNFDIIELFYALLIHNKFQKKQPIIIKKVLLNITSQGAKKDIYSETKKNRFV